MFFLPCPSPVCVCVVPQALRGSAGVALEVEDARDLAAINYARQGNAELYSEDMLVARHGLRADPRVSGTGFALPGLCMELGGCTRRTCWLRGTACGQTRGSVCVAHRPHARVVHGTWGLSEYSEDMRMARHGAGEGERA